MEIDFAITSLEDAVDPSALRGVDVYVFGSATRPGTAAHDLDVLLVYPDGEVGRAHRLAEAFRNSDGYPLIDVLALSTSEEASLRFVENESAVLLWP